MAIAILVGRDEKETKQFHWFISDWKRELLALDSTLDIRTWPDIGNPEEIDTALVWRHPFGALKQLPNLKLIASLAAGVDHITADPDLTKNVAVVRVKDAYMANDIVQYVLACVLIYVKRMEVWAANQPTKLWSRKPPFNYSDKTIGILGLGFLGGKAAQALSDIGLKVTGWSTSPKNLTDIKNYSGKKEFDAFLSQTDILICMLPLTAETENILNRDTFSRLKKGAYVINLGRGEHLVEKDLTEMLATDQLSGACLDVFRQEPLPADHPFWVDPKIRITPHIASVTNAATAAPQVYENYKRLTQGRSLINLVDQDKGY